MSPPAGRAARTARRLYPLALAAYERWRSLPPEERERYRRLARDYADRGRRTVSDARARRAARKPYGTGAKVRKRPDASGRGDRPTP